MKEEVRKANAQKLYRALDMLSGVDEIEAFLQDLCTESEINAMSQRLAVAQMIYRGKKYDEIAEATGASPAIISRVKRYMTNYEKYKIFERLEDEL